MAGSPRLLHGAGAGDAQLSVRIVVDTFHGFPLRAQVVDTLPPAEDASPRRSPKLSDERRRSLNERARQRQQNASKEAPESREVPAGALTELAEAP